MMENKTKSDIVTEYEYNENDVLIYTKDSHGLECMYDDNGNIIYEKDIDSSVFRWYITYDEFGRKKREEMHCLVRNYNYDGKPDSKIFNEGVEQITYEYDDHNRVSYKKYITTSFRKKSNGREYKYEYDNIHNITTLYRKDSDGDEFEFKFNEHGDMIYRKWKDGKEYTWEYEYDDRGNVLYCKDSDEERRWEYKYDDHGKIIYCKFPDGDERRWEYKYDDHGNMIYKKGPNTYNRKTHITI